MTRRSIANVCFFNVFAAVALGILGAASFGADAIAPAIAPSKEPGAAMILSTGDNLFYYKWFPIDSSAGIHSSFEIFKSDYNIDRIIWRGAQAQWMADDNVFRTPSEEIADLYNLEMNLETKEHLSFKGAEEARKSGLAYWGYMPFFEVGQSEEAVSMSGFGPYNFEEKIRAEHPEFRLYDRAGIASGSTIEFGYPEVRKRYLDRYDKMLSQGGAFSIYDGIIFYTYVENFFPRFSDQFIYSNIAAKDFKARYGVDVYSEPFDMDKYLALRGEYVTEYLRELKAIFNKHGKKLAFYVDAGEPEMPMRWPSYPGILVPGRVKMDWRTWVKEGLVDEICLRSASKIEDVQPFLDATRGTSVKLSLLTNQMPPALRSLYDQGVTRHIWSPELPSDFPHGNHPLSDLDSTDRIAVMSVLRQIRDGELDAPVEKLTALFSNPDLMVRRQAVAAILGRRMTDAIPALEKAASNPESSFRAVVIDALGTLNGPNTVAAIGCALEQYPLAGMRLVARTAWSMMVPERTDDLVKLYRESKSAYVRAAIVEMLVSKRAVPAIDAIPEFRALVTDAAADPAENLRAIAAFATAYYPDVESAKLLLKLTDDPSEAVQNDAIFSLGEIARRIDDRATREAIYQTLLRHEKMYGASDSVRTDEQWGYRIVAESMMYGFGPRGELHVVNVLNGDSPRLADLAWKVLFHPNDGWNFYPIDRDKGEALYAYHPGENRTKIAHKTYELPAQTEIIAQSFAGITSDPMGIVGNIWSVGGKWTGMDQNVSFTSSSGKTFLQLGTGKNGKGARIIGTRAYDLADGRFKNRLHGHFPASPVAYGLADGVVELAIDIRKSDRADAIQVALASDANARKLVGLGIAKDGQVQVIAGDPDAATATTSRLTPGDTQHFTLHLDFASGKGGLSVEGKTVQEFSFDNNRQYRALVLREIGDPETLTQVSDLRLTQTFEGDAQ